MSTEKLAERLVDGLVKGVELLRELTAESKGSDNGCVVVAHAFVHEDLTALLTIHLQRMSGVTEKEARDILIFVAPDFGKQNMMALGLGFIDKGLHTTLAVFNKLRNTFGHNKRTAITDSMVNGIFGMMDAEDVRNIRGMAKGYSKKAQPGWSVAKLNFTFIAAYLLLLFGILINSEKRRSMEKHKPFYSSVL